MIHVKLSKMIPTSVRLLVMVCLLSSNAGADTINGSLCVGLDCPASPAFGFDTIRLQENNLRIHIDDTSSTAGFPANDWRFIFNDSSSGGASYFALDDSTAGRQVFRVDAGAPANSLRVDSGGDVGIGTSNPVVDLHMKSGNTPTVRLEQDGSSGFSSQTWDMAGNEANFFIRDTTNGSTLPFRIQPGAPTNAISIKGTTGNVGMGTNSPSHALHILETSKDMLLLENTGGSTQLRTLMKLSNQGPVGFEMEDRANIVTWQFRSDGAANFIVNNPANAGAELKVDKNNGDLTVKGSVTANGVLLTSSRASKTDIAPIKPAEVMEKLKKVEIAEWRYKKADKNDRHISPMAEDFYSLFKLGPDNKHINPNDLASVAIIAAKELQKKAEAMDAVFKADTSALKAENTSLKDRLASLEKLITQLAAGNGQLAESGAEIALHK